MTTASHFSGSSQDFNLSVCPIFIFICTTSHSNTVWPPPTVSILRKSKIFLHQATKSSQVKEIPLRLSPPSSDVFSRNSSSVGSESLFPQCLQIRLLRRRPTRRSGEWYQLSRAAIACSTCVGPVELVIPVNSS